MKTVLLEAAELWKWDQENFKKARTFHTELERWIHGAKQKYVNKHKNKGRVPEVVDFAAKFSSAFGKKKTASTSDKRSASAARWRWWDKRISALWLGWGLLLSVGPTEMTRRLLHVTNASEDLTIWSFHTLVLEWNEKSTAIDVFPEMMDLYYSGQKTQLRY